MELKFKRDTAIRKQFFTPESFAHPAKMDAQLLMWIVEQYTKAGETILDPMSGMGTTILACTMGRNVVLVELEQKFIRMCLNNLEKVRMMPQLGYTMGECPVLWGDARNILSAREHPYEDLWLKYPTLDYATIKAIRRHYNLALKGDARQLEGLLVDKCIFSPPFAEAHQIHDIKFVENIADKQSKLARAGLNKTHPFSTEAKLRYWEKQKLDADSLQNIGNLPYGSMDSVITSPPYQKDAELHGESHEKGREDGCRPRHPYIDHIITSPPYEEGGGHGRGQALPKLLNEKGIYLKGAGMYSESKENIGEMRGQSYLSAMLQVYEQCHKVLKPQGLMILVTKNFIRNRQVVRLDLDTIKLCEQAGFEFIERHYRKLPAQSFWRTIYYKKYPDVEKLEYEDILVFKAA